jgi:Arc/MetJ-type ribon-helix-helix transcriptional regulator
MTWEVRVRVLLGFYVLSGQLNEETYLMTEVFPSDLQQFVQQELASGHYRNEDELLVEAVRYYRDSNIRLRELREEIRTSLEQLDRGEGIELADDAALEAFFDQIDVEVRSELAAEKKARQ